MNKSIRLIGLGLIASMLFGACIKQMYTITVEVNNPEWGTVSGDGAYFEGQTATLVATPYNGYYFSSWSDGVTTSRRTVTVNGNAVYRAIFSDTPSGGGGGGTVDPTHFSGSIDGNTTWPDLGLEVDYIIDGWVSINGNALLTIEPGVTIMFTGTNGGISVGENAGLRMVGTVDKPIVFEGPTNNPNNGSWNRIQIKSKRNDNQWEYVQFLRGGSYDGQWYGVVDAEGAKLSMKNCTIDGSLGMGMDLEYETQLTAFEGNVIKNCADYPINVEYMVSAFDLNSNNTFVSNGKNLIQITGSSYELTENKTLNKCSIPYYFKGGMYLNGNRTFTIAAGTELVFPYETQFNVSSQVAFKAEGTATEPIIFCGEDGDTQWKGIKLESTRTGNVISHCQFSDGGVNDSWTAASLLVIRSDAKLTLTDNSFSNSNYYGIWIEDISNFGNVTHSGNTFSGCSVANVHLEYAGDFGGTHYDAGSNLNDLP